MSSNFASRLRDLRRTSGLSQADLGGELNISPSAIGMYEQGRREPSYEMLENIADFFDVDLDFLIGKSDKTTVLNPARLSPRFLGENISRIISTCHNLNTQGQEKVATYADDLDKSGQYRIDFYDRKIVVNTGQFMAAEETPVYTVGRAAAGSGAYSDGYHDEAPLLVKTEEVPRHDKAIIITGSSMEPTIQDGSVAYLLEDYDLQNGKVYSVTIGEESYVKRLYKEDGKLTLRSDNPDVDDITVTGIDLETVRLEGRVVGWSSGN